MSTLADRTSTAVLVIDAQNAVLEGTHRRDEVVAAIGRLVDRSRREGVPVVWVQHSSDDLARDSEPWQIVPELAPAEGEPVVHKQYGDSFEDTDLEQVLAGLGVGRLVVSGAQTDECIRSTIHGGLTRGYDVTLVDDAHTTEDLSEWGAPTPDLVIAHTNLYWENHRAPGRTAGVAHADEVELAAAAV